MNQVSLFGCDGCCCISACAGLEASSWLNENTPFSPSYVEELSCSAFYHPHPPAHHRARLDLDSNLSNCTRGSLEASWELHPRYLTSITLGRDLLKPSTTAWGFAAETLQSKGSGQAKGKTSCSRKLFGRVFVERCYGKQLLLQLQQLLPGNAHLLDAAATWHCVPGSVPFTQCKLSCTFSGFARPVAQGLQLGEQGSKLGTGDNTQQQERLWSVVVGWDPACLKAWSLSVMLHGGQSQGGETDHSMYTGQML